MQRVSIPVAIFLDRLGFFVCLLFQAWLRSNCVHCLSIWTQSCLQGDALNTVCPTRAHRREFLRLKSPWGVYVFIQRDLPTVVVFNAVIDWILAHPGVSSACAPVQRGFHIRAAVIRSLALAHDQHLSHVAGHAPIEALCCLLASIRAALARRAGLEKGR